MDFELEETEFVDNGLREDEGIGVSYKKSYHSKIVNKSESTVGGGVALRLTSIASSKAFSMEKRSSSIVFKVKLGLMCPHISATCGNCESFSRLTASSPTGPS